MSAFFSRTFAASAAADFGADGAHVDVKFTGADAGEQSIGPIRHRASAAAFVTIVNVTSDAAATALGESANFIPLSISHCAFDRVRL